MPMLSLDEIVSANSSGGTFAGTLTLTCHPGSVSRLMVEYFAETMRQFHALRSLAIVALQSLAEEGAFTSAANSLPAALSRATIAGVANRGRHIAASLVAA